MRILHCIAQLPDATGSGIYFRSLYEGFAKNGIENGLVFACQDGLQRSFPDAKYQYTVQFASKDLPFNIAGMSDIMPYPSTVYSSMSDEQLRLWKAAFSKALLNAKKKFNPDIVICHHLFILASIVKEIFKDRPIYIICHGTDIRQRLQHVEFCKANLSHTNDFDGYFTLSSADKTKLIELYNIDGEKINVTGGAYDKSIFKPDGHKRGKRLFYCGKIAESKGVYELAAAYKIVKQSHKAELLLCGNADTEQKRRLRELAGFTDFHTHHAENQKIMARIMRKYDIFILPSYYEGLGLVALEALASGLLLVAAKHNGLYELLGDRINNSGIVRYVDLPRLYDTDKPYPEDKPDYIKRLAEAINAQIENIDTDYSYLNAEIESHSWDGLVKNIMRIVGIA